MDSRQHETESAGSSPISRLLYWCAVGALIALGVWVVSREMPNPDFEKAMMLRGQLAMLEDDADDRRESLLFDLRRVMDDLDQPSRDRVVKAMQIDMQMRRQRAIDRFFDLPQGEQIAELDRRIDDMEARRLYAEQLERDAEEEQVDEGQVDEQVETKEVAVELTASKSDAVEHAEPAKPQEVGQQRPTLDDHSVLPLDAIRPPRTEPPLPGETADQRVDIPRYRGSRHSLEHLTSEQRQRREEFYRMLYERRQQRGLPPYSSYRRL